MGMLTPISFLKTYCLRHSFIEPNSASPCDKQSAHLHAPHTKIRGLFMAWEQQNWALSDQVFLLVENRWLMTILNLPPPSPTTNLFVLNRI